MKRIEHISGSIVPVNMSDAETYRCYKACMATGETPCYSLPSVTSTWPPEKPVEPCGKCRDENND